MAPVPASLDISFISNFTGQHRVCWRIPPSLVYNCSTVVFCPGGGNPCTATIPITVDNESCDPVTYEGYVQAACEDPLSLNGRIPFSITFTPVPTCASYRVSCVGVGIASITITNAGTGYDPLNPPAGIPFGGGGSGVTVTITVGNAMTTLNPGAGYTNGVYPGVPVINVLGTGVGAIATVTVAGGVVSGYVFTTSGSGYFPGDTFTFNDVDLGGGGGTGFSAGFAAGYGTITLVTVNTPGTGYTSAPGFALPAPPSGTVALIDAVLADCVDQVLGLACDGSPAQTITNMPLGQSAIECMQLPLPVINTEYTFVPEACCYDCITVTFSVLPLNAPATVYYTDCSTHLIVAVPILSGGTTGPICVVNNSWYYTNAVSVVLSASCP